MHLCSIRLCPSGLGGYYALLVDSKVTRNDFIAAACKDDYDEEEDGHDDDHDGDCDG